jgi:hypothetical protein
VDEHGPIKKVWVSALIVVIIVALIVAVILVGEVIDRWLS